MKIAERYGFHYVSVGELLRKKMIHNATSNRKWSLIAKIITNGELAPQVGVLSVCVLVLVTHTEYHNANSTSKVRTLSGSEDVLTGRHKEMFDC